MATYTVHIGTRSDEWPSAYPETFPTRGDAQNAVKRLLSHPGMRTAGFTKGEVRCCWRLLDCYSARTACVRHVYSALQRVRRTDADA